MSGGGGLCERDGRGDMPIYLNLQYIIFTSHRIFFYLCK